MYNIEEENPLSEEAVQAWPFRPLPALAIGLVLVSVLKQVWIFNYMFNFLATLVHEIGHTIFAWLMGMPSFPSVSLFGGGVTRGIGQIPLLCVGIIAALCWYAWQVRAERHWFIATIYVTIVYALLAFTKASENLVVAGGVLFEIGGACACFYWVLCGRMNTPLERPLYALWGWWMLLNRLGETYLMLRNPSYWDERVIIQSGFGEGLVNDLPRLCEELNLSPQTVLLFVLWLCLGALPTAFLLRWLKQRALQTEVA